MGRGSSSKIENYTLLNFVGFLITCFSSVMMAVFLAASQTYFITDALGIGKNVGNYIGTLSFCDELLSMIIVPFVGVLSDRIGTRPILCFGFFLMGISLFGFAFFVRVSVYPWMLFWRLLFAFGLTSSLGVLTVMLLELNNSNFVIGDYFSFQRLRLSNNADSDDLAESLAQATESLGFQGNLDGDGYTGVIHSDGEEQTAAAAAATTLQGLDNLNKKRSDGKKASIMGTMTGIGAVFAVLVLLRLPVWYGQSNTASVALRKSYYTVGFIAILISIVLFFTVYKDENKKMFRDDIDDLFEELDARDAVDGIDDNSLLEEDLLYGNPGVFTSRQSYFASLKRGVQLSIQNPTILVAYFGGFVGRCVTVTTAIFIPFFINHYFYSSGKCSTEELDKIHCPESYVLVSILTGVANTMTLFFAPVVGIFIDRMNNHAHALLITNLISIIGFISVPFVSYPDDSVLIIVAVCFMGISQISFIIISMTMLSNISSQDAYYRYKGSITGVSQFVGATGILVVALLGGISADVYSASPFVIVAVINAIFIGIIFRLRSVKVNDDRKIGTVWNKFKSTRFGGLIFGSPPVNSDDF